MANISIVATDRVKLIEKSENIFIEKLTKLTVIIKEKHVSLLDLTFV